MQLMTAVSPNLDTLKKIVAARTKKGPDNVCTPSQEFQNLFPAFWGKRTVQFLARFEVHLRGFCFLFFPSLLFAFCSLAKVGGEIVIFRRGELESVAFDQTMR